MNVKARKLAYYTRGFFIENTRTVSVTEFSSLLVYYPLIPYRYGITVNSNVCNAETFHFCHVETTLVDHGKIESVVRTVNRYRSNISLSVGFRMLSDTA